MDHGRDPETGYVDSWNLPGLTLLYLNPTIKQVPGKWLLRFVSLATPIAQMRMKKPTRNQEAANCQVIKSNRLDCLGTPLRYMPAWYLYLPTTRSGRL